MVENCFTIRENNKEYNKNYIRWKKNVCFFTNISIGKNREKNLKWEKKNNSKQKIT